MTLIADHNEAVNEYGSTEAQLEAAFALVEDKEDWRNPIDAVVTMKQGGMVMQAIEFYTGTKPTVAKFEDGDILKEVDGIKYIRLVSVGYRNGPCGP